ncbi:MAG: DUF4845 domain-containing protein [Pseudomonadota bacterium]|jgi:hypothetical protein
MFRRQGGLFQRQRGISLVKVLLGGILIGLLAVSAMRLVPPVVESYSISSIFKRIVADPEMANALPPQIRAAFDKQAEIDRITAIRSNQIQIYRGGGVLSLSAQYEVVIPLHSRVRLVLSFSPSSQ